MKITLDNDFHHPAITIVVKSNAAELFAHLYPKKTFYVTVKSKRGDTSWGVEANLSGTGNELTFHFKGERRGIERISVEAVMEDEAGVKELIHNVEKWHNDLQPTIIQAQRIAAYEMKKISDQVRKSLDPTIPDQLSELRKWYTRLAGQVYAMETTMGDMVTRLGNLERKAKRGSRSKAH